MSVWQLIETAPLDQYIDVWVTKVPYGSEEGRYTNVKWSAFYKTWLPVGSAGHGRDHIYGVTHWMPRPYPPAMRAAEEES